MAQVKINNLKKVFGSVPVIHGLDLEIADKEFVVLVGPSGCGKSTVLRMIAGLEEISAGEIQIGERVVNNLPPKARNIAMVFQNYALYPHMTVAKNIAFGLRSARMPKAEIEVKVREAATMLGLDGLLDRRPNQLSGGQRQRVAMGRAIVRNPSVFLFDEPLSNLDAKLRDQVRTEIKKLHQKIQTTIIYVTHDQVEAMTLADRIVIMRAGKIEQIGSPLEVYHNPANIFVATFIGSPAMNLIDGVLEGDRIRLKNDISVPVPQNRFSTSGENTAKHVKVGIRPQDLVAGKNEQMQNAVTLQAPVQVVEPLGGSTHLSLNLGGEGIMAMSYEKVLPDVGDTIEVAFSTENMHLFDRETGEALWKKSHNLS